MGIVRNVGEDFAAFKERREEDNYNAKQALKPKMFWDSYMKGTYINPQREAEREHKKARQVQRTPNGSTAKINLTN